MNSEAVRSTSADEYPEIHTLCTVYAPRILHTSTRPISELGELVVQHRETENWVQRDKPLRSVKRWV